MSDTVVWLIIVGFYIPLHFIPPLGITYAFIGGEPETRKSNTLNVLFDVLATTLITFVLIFWLAEGHLQTSMIIMLLSVLLPYIRVAKLWRNAFPEGYEPDA